LQANWVEKHFCELHELYSFEHINKENGGTITVVTLLEQPACILPSALLVNHAWANGNVKEEWLPADKNKRELCKRTVRKREDKQCYRAWNVIA